MQSVNVNFLDAAPVSEWSVPRAEAEYALKVTMLYQDITTQEWAKAMWSQVMRLAGQESLRVASWKIGELSWPGMLLAAVQSAAQADVVVVAVSAAEELPLELHAWFDVWLLRRVRRRGALVALINAAEGPGHQASRALDYFRAVARKGGLDFFPEQRATPAASIEIQYQGSINDEIQPSLCG
jgi:hypothetical protein